MSIEEFEASLTAGSRFSRFLLEGDDIKTVIVNEDGEQGVAWFDRNEHAEKLLELFDRFPETK
jgi:hypothetical protein